MDATNKPSQDAGQTPLPDSRRGTRSHGFVDDRKVSQVAHTLTACCRCRQRKTRCDAGLPRCSPCERNNAPCDYFDATKGRKMSRSYVVHLQDKVRRLEAELDGLKKSSSLPVDFELLVRGAGLVKIGENDESRFLGPSSGIAMTRLVMELAKELCNVKSIKEIVPESMAQGIKERFAQEHSKPTSKVYPLISFVAAPHLPSRDLTDKLVENFNAKAQIHYPVLHEPSFQAVVEDVYRGSTDDYQNFMVRMVIALSMHKLDTQYAGLADSYYLAALPYLENAIRPMNLGTLQCFALIAEYSMTTPTRTAAYWVVGLATKLLQDLGMTDEATIDVDKSGRRLDALEVDLRRRLFWVMATMELGLAHSLGRPSAFAFTHDHPDIRPFLEFDDQYITPEGAIPGSPLSLKKQVAIHFMKMRYLQLEIRRKLYLKKRQSPVSDSDPWFSQMESKVHGWMHDYPRNNDGNDFSEKWFKIRYHTMIVFLFRPSPQVPHPSIRAARLCFEASMSNIYIQKEQIDSKSADTTWIFTQQLFMAINTILWAMSYAEIREKNPKSEVENHLQTALEAIWWASKKWPGVESALELYMLLVQACLKAYDGNVKTSYGLGSPLQETKASSPQIADTVSPLPTPSTTYSSTVSTGYKPSEKIVSPVSFSMESHETPQRQGLLPQTSFFEYPAVPELPSQGSAIPELAQPYDMGASRFDNPLPPPIDYNYTQNAPENIISLLTSERGLFLGSYGDHYPEIQYLPSTPMDGLNLEQQSELMSTLELYGLKGVPSGDPPHFVANGDYKT